MPRYIDPEKDALYCHCGAKMDGKEPKEDNLKICKHSNGYGYCSLYEGYCCESPCADEELIEYVLLVHGEWKEYDGEDQGYHYCTNCEQQAFNYGDDGNVIEVLSDYCPKCGAIMDGKATDDKTKLTLHEQKED